MTPSYSWIHVSLLQHKVACTLYELYSASTWGMTVEKAILLIIHSGRKMKVSVCMNQSLEQLAATYSYPSLIPAPKTPPIESWARGMMPLTEERKDSCLPTDSQDREDDDKSAVSDPDALKFPGKEDMVAADITRTVSSLASLSLVRTC